MLSAVDSKRSLPEMFPTAAGTLEVCAGGEYFEGD
jgi:hypothetical protein